MKLSQKGIDLIKEFEGFRSYPYLCPAGVPTIGYGATYYPDGTKVSISDDDISNEYAELILKHQVDSIYSEAVNRYVNVTLTQNQFDALVSFTYNVGIGAFQKSTLLKHVNNENHEKAKNEFKKWVRANGKVLKGLKRRRKAEKKLYTT